VDEIRAMACGWETRHYPDLIMKHWKPEGSAMGVLRTSYMHGEIYYRTGGGKLFLLFKFFNRLCSRPIILGGIFMLLGYILAKVRGLNLLVDKDEAKFYRSLLNQRLASKFRFTPRKTVE
jgi:hypothetical protein